MYGLSSKSFLKWYCTISGKMLIFTPRLELGLNSFAFFLLFQSGDVISSSKLTIIIESCGTGYLLAVAIRFSYVYMYMLAWR